MKPKANFYDDFATEYAAAYSSRSQDGIPADPLGILSCMLDLLGDVAGRRVLDAGCGEGYVARALAFHGATVTGLDISPRLIGIARERDPAGLIDFRVADLSQLLVGYEQSFDAAASRLVLNDVADYQGFIATLATVLKPGGRLVVALNNPYSYVVRKHVQDYFAAGTAFPYRGMAMEGIKVHFYQRTLEEYLDAFLGRGFQLTKLVDLATVVNNSHAPHLDTLLPEGYRFPYFMVLSFVTSSNGERGDDRSYPLPAPRR